MFETVFPDIKKYINIKSFRISNNLYLDCILNVYIEISVKYKLSYYPVTKRYRFAKNKRSY